jgi:uncharacterized protein
MRLTKERVALLAQTLTSRLEAGAYLEILSSKQLIQELEHTITEELQVEDRLNSEVRQMMKAHEAEIEQGHVDYQKMFTMIKNKLVKDRGLIL